MIIRLSRAGGGACGGGNGGVWDGDQQGAACVALSRMLREPDGGAWVSIAIGRECFGVLVREAGGSSAPWRCPSIAMGKGAA